MVVNMRVNDKNSNPVIIAPRILAVVISIVMSINEKSIVPSTPVKRSESVGHTQSRVSSSRRLTDTKSATARKATAIPNNTQSKGVPTAIPEVSVRSATITPITTLAIIARVVQLLLH